MFRSAINIMEQQTSYPERNLLLQALPPHEREKIAPHLEFVTLERNDVCIESGRPITFVYFLDGGLGSTVMPDNDQGVAELGAQGYEGLVGVPAILGATDTPHRTFMQVGGSARRIPVDELRTLMDERPALRHLLLRYAQVFLIQISQTAYANARFKVDERLARWILMSADRLGSPASLTHDFLSVMLGVRRPSVTDAIHVLEGEGLIRANRGVIEIRDRQRLEMRTAGCYGVPEREYERLIGPWRSLAILG